MQDPDQARKLMYAEQLLQTSYTIEQLQEFTAHMQDNFFKPMPPPYYALAAAGEAGEMANEVKKLWRAQSDDNGGGIWCTAEDRHRIANEAADVLVYLLCTADAFGFDLGDALRRAYREKIIPRLLSEYYAHTRGTVKDDN